MGGSFAAPALRVSTRWPMSLASASSGATDTTMSPIFLDFEASSLGARSWPIEIGIAWLEGDEVRTRAALIRPHESWPAGGWSRESEALHGISRGALRQAEPAELIARRFVEQLKGRQVVSDAPEFDRFWLGRLLALLPDPPAAPLLDFDALVHLLMSFEARTAVYEHLLNAQAPHRAGGDSVRLARAWRAGMRAMHAR